MVIVNAIGVEHMLFIINVVLVVVIVLDFMVVVVVSVD